MTPSFVLRFRAEDRHSRRNRQYDIPRISVRAHRVYPWRVASFSGLDVRDALALIDDAHSAEDPEEFAERVVEGLVRLVPGEVVGYNEREVVSHRLLTGCEVPSVDPPPEVADAVSTFCGEYP